MNNQGWEPKQIDNQPGLRNFDLNIILTCNIIIITIIIINIKGASHIK